MSTQTGEVYRRAYCDYSGCVPCAPRQCARLAGTAAWALSDVRHVYSVTITPVDLADWPRARKALLRRLRREGDVGWISAVEQAGQTHVHALLWTSFEVKTTWSPQVVIRRVAPTYQDRFNVVMYLTKTVHKQHDLESHLMLNGGLTEYRTKNFFGGMGYQEARSARHQERWNSRTK